MSALQHLNTSGYHLLCYVAKENVCRCRGCGTVDVADAKSLMTAVISKYALSPPIVKIMSLYTRFH